MGTRQGTRSPTRVAVALIAAILLISFVAVEPSEIRYDLSSAHGGFIGAQHADAHLRAAAADARRADPRASASSLGATRGWIGDDGLTDAIHRAGRAREGVVAGEGQTAGPEELPRGVHF